MVVGLQKKRIENHFFNVFFPIIENYSFFFAGPWSREIRQVMRYLVTRRCDVHPTMWLSTVLFQPRARYIARNEKGMYIKKSITGYSFKVVDWLTGWRSSQHVPTAHPSWVQSPPNTNICRMNRFWNKY